MASPVFAMGQQVHRLVTPLLRYLDVIFTPQLAGEARQLGCPKIVLDHVCVLYIFIYIYICLCAPQCLSTRCIGNT